MAIHLITGAGSGIGAALAQRLAARGDDLLLIARNEERADQLRNTFGGAEIVVADLASPQLEATLLEHRAPERLDSVIHAAGVVALNPVANLPTTEFLDTLLVNLVSPIALTRWALPALRAARGSVVFVNSTAGLNANPNWASYAASKAGLRSAADALRAEEAANGVRVTTIFPGRTATPMQQAVRQQEGGSYDASIYIDPATVAAAIMQAIDLPRDATMPEITLRPGP
ncbi:SDR family oxidoreductase [Propionicimonas sp.]|uniref:SDR family oxidoreductase n=2 Tax=Propionicimonas sp. TaxID=1955623 RepID=UPI0017DFA94D|nr:SDR family oxidoreductase [Propionicimonas sp.]MBU3976112.1 SDR family oxidoreductase [Actinomycetota bacterium]MBA3020925.1 SDR family oxidoreductase [Propionicimonas sp.]MBU3985302.1 SDR family oxidoreductase [Actinomycetota bacterium]MBU4008292.1 SDR family oxidoreductase [Actinomycetota bacterium]MBU4064494.1 SDR family oxidoreductase [Actinomycetota bacterium]